MADAHTAIGTIEKMGATKNGTKTAKVGGVDYMVSNKVDTQSWVVGTSIDFEYSISEYNGKTYKWINNWAKAPTNSKPGDSAEYTGNGELPNGPYIDPTHLACISNVLAHVIDKGLLGEPAEIHKWIEATQCALRGKEWLPTDVRS